MYVRSDVERLFDLGPEMLLPFLAVGDHGVVVDLDRFPTELPLVDEGAFLQLVAVDDPAGAPEELKHREQLAIRISRPKPWWVDTVPAVLLWAVPFLLLGVVFGGARLLLVPRTLEVRVRLGIGIGVVVVLAAGAYGAAIDNLTRLGEDEIGGYDTVTVYILLGPLLALPLTIIAVPLVAAAWAWVRRRVQARAQTP